MAASRDALNTLSGFLEFKLRAKQGVGSECVKNVEYDEFTGELTIEFQERGTYKYSNFPLTEMASFIGSSSKGTYFNLYIRDKYSYERVG